jgi:hypothetical protein
MPDYLTQAIEILHQGMVDEQDPEAIATVSQCVTALTRLQAKKTNQPAAQDPRAALVAQLGGQG